MSALRGAATRSAAVLACKGWLNDHVAVDANRSVLRLEFGAVTIIPDERLVLKDGRPVPLTPKAFDLLAVFAANPGHLLTKEQLMEALWPDTSVEEANLAYHVFAIRKALDENADGDRYIETVPKRGYRFVAPVVRIEADGPGLSRTAESTTGMLESAEQAHAARPTEIEALSDRQSSRFGVALRRWWLALAAGLAIGALTMLWGLGERRPGSVPNGTAQFQEPITGRLAETGVFSVSPDGRHLLFAAEGRDGALRLWVRALSTLQPVPLPGTEVFGIIPPPVWSPDSRFVAFSPTAGSLKTVGLDGGTPQSVCELSGVLAVGGSWNSEGDILLGNAAGGLARCAASGGPATTVTVVDQSEQELHIFPSFLSDGRRFIYLRISRTKPETSGIYTSELGSGLVRIGNRLITTGFGAAFVAGADSELGFIVFARDGSLFAQRFDERQLEVIGDPMRLADRVGSYLDGAFFSVSPKTLVYRAPDPDFQLTWFNRDGRELGRVGAPARFTELTLSPEGDRALVAMHAPQGTANQDLWLFDLSRSSFPTRVTFEPTLEFSPVWSTNDRFVFGSTGGPSGVYQQTVGGLPQLLFKTGRPEAPTSITPDERILLFNTPAETPMGGDVWVRTGEGVSAIVRPFLQRERDQSEAQLSPDSRWVAYVSNEGGPNEVFVTELRLDAATGTVSSGEGIRISEGGGVAPRWRRDGRELFYLTLDGSVMAVEVDTTRAFRTSQAKRLFTVAGVIPEWGVTQDGARFLVAVPVTPPPPFTIVQDWQAALPK